MLTHPYYPFFILPSSFKQATVSAALPADITSPHQKHQIPPIAILFKAPPTKMKNIKTETYDFQFFMTLSQEK